MKHEQSRRTGYEGPASQIEPGAANDELYETDLERVSAVSYERRREMWTKFDKGDWWIAIGVYLILSGMAFVVL